jgi:hypothetical protein
MIWPWLDTMLSQAIETRVVGASRFVFVCGSFGGKERCGEDSIRQDILGAQQRHGMGLAATLWK